MTDVDSNSLPESLKPCQPFFVDGFDWSWAFVVFREIRNFTGYWVGSNGSLWSYRDNSGKTKSSCKPLIANPMKSGHLKVTLTDNAKKRRPMYVHAVVLETFLGPRPDGLVCRHRDGNPQNNNLYNISWGTVLDNIRDRDVIHKTTAVGESYPHTTLKNKDIGIIYDLYESGWYVKAIAEQFKIDTSECAKILKGVYWSHAVPGRKPPLRGTDGRLAVGRIPGQRSTKNMRNGESHWNSKLSKKEADEIRALYSSGGQDAKTIAARFGVTTGVIYRIINGISYR